MFRMTNPAAHLPEEDDPDARTPTWARRHLGMLVDLGDMGMVLARNLVRRVTAETEAAEAQAETGEAVASPGRGPVIDPALSFTRISRAVRLTIALEARMRREIEAGVFGPANDDGPAQQDFMTPDGQVDYEAISRQIAAHVDLGPIQRSQDYEIRRAVEETIEAASDDPDEVERLREELKERLEEDEGFEQRVRWPIGEAIALICQDLGIDPDWDRLKTRDWAIKEAAENQRGSPYSTAVLRPRLPREGPRSATERYREARGLPRLEGPPPLRAARKTPLPEGEGTNPRAEHGRVKDYGPSG
jgi:hypothetical protein